MNALFDRTGTDRGTGPNHSPLATAEPSLYGREDELERLLTLLHDARDGRGGLVLISGEAGIGKTTLVDTLIARANGLDVHILTGACYDLATTPPYGPWIEALREYGTEAAPSTSDAAPAALLHEGDEANPSPATQDVQFASVQRFLGDVSRDRPLLLVFEDQHWADPDSLKLLRYLGRSLADQPIVIVVTYRDVDLTAQSPLYRYLPQLVREARPLRLALRRIGPDATREIVARRYDLAAADEERLANYLHGHAEGNPFFTEELLRALEHDRLLTPVSSGWQLADLAAAQVPLLIRQMIDARVAWLDEPAQRVIQVAAVIGQDVDLRLWAEATDADDDTLAGVIEDAISAQLLQEAPGGRGMRFTHALVRESIYDSIVLPRRRSWHRTIGELLAAHPDAEPDTVAHHFQQARDLRAATWLMQAGERAARSNAVQDAVERFEQALHLLEAQGDDARLDDRAWLLSNLAGAYRYTDPPLALEYLDRARQLLDRSTGPALAAIVLWSRARIRGFLGEDTREDMDQAIAAYHALSPEDWQRVRTMGRGVAGSQGALSQWLSHHGRYADALRIGLDCLQDQQDATRTAYHQTEIGHAQLGIALSQAGLGRPEEAREAFLAAKQHFGGAWHYFMAAAAVKWEEIDLVMAYHADDIAWRDRLVGEYERIWLQTTNFPVSPAHSGSRPLLPLYPPLVTAGRWSEVVEAALAYLSDSYLRVDALAALAEVERGRGQRTSAWQHIHQGIPDGPATAPGTPFFVRTLALQRIAADLAIDEGQLDHAMEWIEAHERWLDWSGRVLDRSSSLLLRARHAEAQGDIPAALRVVRDAIARAEHPRQPLALLSAHRMAAHLTILLGRHDDATGHLRAAGSLADACDAPFERAQVWMEQAALLIATDHAADATPILANARAAAEALGAAPLLGQIAELEGKLPRRRTISAGDLTVDLSPRELDVLQLVARGMTDAEVAERLFISPRTVARHLQSVYNKLGVSSRTAASAFAFQHGLVLRGDGR